MSHINKMVNSQIKTNKKRNLRWKIQQKNVILTKILSWNKKIQKIAQTYVN